MWSYVNINLYLVRSHKMISKYGHGAKTVQQIKGNFKDSVNCSFGAVNIKKYWIMFKLFISDSFERINGKK